MTFNDVVLFCVTAIIGALTAVLCTTVLYAIGLPPLVTLLVMCLTCFTVGYYVAPYAHDIATWLNWLERWRR